MEFLSFVFLLISMHQIDTSPATNIAVASVQRGALFPTILISRCQAMTDQRRGGKPVSWKHGGFPTNGGWNLNKPMGFSLPKKWTRTWGVKWGLVTTILGNTHKKCRKYWDFTVDGWMDVVLLVHFHGNEKRYPTKTESWENQKCRKSVGWIYLDSSQVW